MWYLDPAVHFLKTLVAENCSGSRLEEKFGVLQNYDDFYNAFDIVTAPFQHLNYEVTLHLMTHNWKSNATLCILMPLSVIFLENIGYLPTLLSNACPFNAVLPSSGRPALCLFALLAFFAILTMQRDHLQAVTTFVCCFPRAWIAAFVSRQKINSGLALREFGLFPQGTTFFSPMLWGLLLMLMVLATALFSKFWFSRVCCWQLAYEVGVAETFCKDNAFWFFREQELMSSFMHACTFGRMSTPLLLVCFYLTYFIWGKGEIWLKERSEGK